MYSEQYETPDDFVKALGWIWDEENKYFKHPKSNQIFYSIYLYWNNKKWLVPLYSDTNEVDKVTARTFKYSISNSGDMYSVELNSPLNFNETRRGKRYKKYLRYLKRRERNKKSYSHKEMTN